ncbi:serine hydrolase domain-containing protein [Nocardia sp. NPDC051570]|uniref:serine hydrolase domain-containing protein n=1 Tax=Nocardia sp. NPDC051570 TaxID=3364324 RepID=UPI00378789ED
MRVSRLAAVLSAAILLVGCSSDDGRSTARAASLISQSSPLRTDIEALLRSGATGVIVTVTDQDRHQTLTGGFADLATSRPIPQEPAQQVRVGRITETFTAALVLQLVGEDRIRLDAPIETYLPGLLRGDAADGHAITVRQLLRHQSGLPELTDGDRAARAYRTTTPQEQIEIALSHPAAFAPGTHARYSNTDYIVCGLLIEKVTGTSYADELTRRILEPLQLTDTYLPAPGDLGIRGPHPTGYATIDGRTTEATPTEPTNPWSSGALISTGPDLNRFYTELRAGEVISPAQLQEMLNTVGLEEGRDYGLGIRTQRLPCGTTYSGHRGGGHGYTTIVGATIAGRAVTATHTGTATSGPDLDILLRHALCP